jgi:hypothetical protein
MLAVKSRRCSPVAPAVEKRSQSLEEGLGSFLSGEERAMKQREPEGNDCRKAMAA